MSSCETDIKERNERSDINSETEQKTNTLKTIGNVVSRRFFPLGSVFVILFGIFVPQPAMHLGKNLPLIKICIVAIKGDNRFMEVGGGTEPARRHAPLKLF